MEVWYVSLMYLFTVSAVPKRLYARRTMIVVRRLGHGQTTVHRTSDRDGRAVFVFETVQPVVQHQKLKTPTETGTGVCTRTEIQLSPERQFPHQ